ncbi:MAG TPA: hypothetical protein VKP61_11560 [Candidatus Acidoferrum sp.]|nr:hypothetical protein [Candidatus Acidoferrum sp.]
MGWQVRARRGGVFRMGKTSGHPRTDDPIRSKFSVGIVKKGTGKMPALRNMPNKTTTTNNMNMKELDDVQIWKQY